MRLRSLKVSNYRTLEAVNMTFPQQYCALCGKNNAGKTTIVRAIELILPRIRQPFIDPDDIDFPSSYPAWKIATKEAATDPIQVELTLSLDMERDAGLVDFIKRFVSVEETTSSPDITIGVAVSKGSQTPDVTVLYGDKAVEGSGATEILSRIRSTMGVLYHNSTELDDYRYIRRYRGWMTSPVSRGTEGPAFDKAKKAVERFTSRLVRSNQQELSALLGKLDEKYEVSLTVPAFDPLAFPMEITLSDKEASVGLDDWGSGTKNRTHIFMTLLHAQRAQKAADAAKKLAPVVIIEEPESYLHPSAQAEFGRILQDIAAEFDIQLIVTTHSPYMLNTRNPESNILLERQVVRKRTRGTVIGDTSGDQWMRPFALALGIDSEELAPWKKLVFGSGSEILLVEGDTDAEYMKILQDERNGANALKFKGDIFPYGGKDSLNNTILLKFIIERYNRVLLTFDLDAKTHVEKTLKGLGLRENVNYIAIGDQNPGHDCIEGMLPQEVKDAVHASNAGLISRLASGDNKVRNNARSEYKGKLLDQFKANLRFDADYMGKLWACSKRLNAASGLRTM